MIKNDLESVQPEEQQLNGIYRGVVEDNKSDPQKSGRCKIRIIGLHTKTKKKTGLEGIPTEELPWAEPVMGLFEGSVTGFGSWTIPLQGSHVFVFFEGGNLLQPRYFATVPGIPTEEPNTREGFNDPEGEYPVSQTNAPHQPNELDEPDFHRLGREETEDTIVESKENKKDTGISTADGGSWDEPSPYYSAKYPDNKVFSTHSGITIEIDDTDGEERIHVYHPSNSYIEINKNGSIVIRNAQDKFDIVDNDKKAHVGSNYDRTVDSNRTSKVGSNETEEVGGDHKKDIRGDTTINTRGETINTSQDDSTVNGANVNLNRDKGSVHSIVTTGHVCAITGLPHPYGSSTCFAHMNSPTNSGSTN